MFITIIAPSGIILSHTIICSVNEQGFSGPGSHNVLNPVDNDLIGDHIVNGISWSEFGRYLKDFCFTRFDHYLQNNSTFDNVRIKHLDDRIGLDSPILVKIIQFADQYQGTDERVRAFCRDVNSNRTNPVRLRKIRIYNWNNTENGTGSRIVDAITNHRFNNQ